MTIIFKQGSKFMKKVKYILLILLTVIIAGCVTSAINISSDQVMLSKHANFGVIPFKNNTNRPQAGNSAAAITAGILQTMGANKAIVYQPMVAKNALIDNPNKTISKRVQLLWARRNHIRYLITGTVNEWRYKVGLDGEPAVNVSLRLYDVRTHKHVWNAVGSVSGGSRDGLGVVAQRLLASLLSYICLV